MTMVGTMQFQSTIKEKLEADPSLHGEEAHEEDLYSTLFSKGTTSTRHGFGLVVGGRGSEKIDQVISALWESQEENKNLRRILGNLMENQKYLKAQNDTMKEQNEMVMNKCNQMMVLFEASQKQNPTQDVEDVEGRGVSKQQSTLQTDAIPTTRVEAQVDPCVEVDKTKKKRKEMQLKKQEVT